jgi:hypothetical protein
MPVCANVYSNALLAMIHITIENTFTLKSPLTPLFQRGVFPPFGKERLGGIL